MRKKKFIKNQMAGVGSTKMYLENSVDRCKVCGNISYFRMSSSEIGRRLYFFTAFSKFARVISRDRSSNSI